jgi:16S rRNA processing protein RimM
MAHPGMLLAGEIGKPHGISGEVYVFRISDDPRRFEPGSRLVHADGRDLIVESGRSHGNRWLVKFEGASTKEDALELRGLLFVPPEEVRTLDEDEFWPHELTGCEVVLVSGEGVGRVTDVVARGAQDLIEVETGHGARLVPLVKAIVTDVDLGARRVTVDAPPGLLD